MTSSFGSLLIASTILQNLAGISNPITTIYLTKYSIITLKTPICYAIGDIPKQHPKAAMTYVSISFNQIRRNGRAESE